SLKDQIKKMELNEELKQKDMKDLEQEILNQKNTIDQKDNELRNYATSNALLFKENKDLKTARENLEKNKNLEIEDLKRQISELNKTIESKDNIILSLQQQRNKDSNTILQKDNHINKLNNLLKEEKEKVSNGLNEIKGHKQEIDNLKIQISTLKLEITKKENEINNKNQTMDEIRNKGKNVIEKYDEQIGNLQNALKTKEDEINKFTKVIDDLKKLSNDKENEINSLKNYIQKSQDQFRASYVKGYELKKANDNNKQTIQGLNERIKELENRLNDSENLSLNPISDNRPSLKGNQLGGVGNKNGKGKKVGGGTQAFGKATGTFGNFEKEKQLNKKLTQENNELKKKLGDILRNCGDKKINVHELITKYETQQKELKALQGTVLNFIESIKKLITKLKEDIFNTNSVFFDPDTIFNNQGNLTMDVTFDYYFKEMENLIIAFIGEFNIAKEASRNLQSQIEQMEKEMDIKKSIGDINVYKDALNNLNKIGAKGKNITSSVGNNSTGSNPIIPNNTQNAPRKYETFMAENKEEKSTTTQPKLNPSSLSLLTKTLTSTQCPPNKNIFPKPGVNNSMNPMGNLNQSNNQPMGQQMNNSFPQMNNQMNQNQNMNQQRGMSFSNPPQQNQFQNFNQNMRMPSFNQGNQNQNMRMPSNPMFNQPQNPQMNFQGGQNNSTGLLNLMNAGRTQINVPNPQNQNNNQMGNPFKNFNGNNPQK
ncbi:MAG: hypothetical protein MJ252_24775, partial [archaeon]|nr:hypothetical protein [archaeon]